MTGRDVGRKTGSFNHFTGVYDEDESDTSPLGTRDTENKDLE